MATAELTQAPATVGFVRALELSSIYALWFAGIAPLGWGVVPLAWLAGPGPRPRREARARAALSSACSRFIDLLRWRRCLDLDCQSVNLELPDGGAVVVANHPTLIDVLMLLGSDPRLTVMARRSRFTTVLLGAVQPACGHISTGRSSPEEGVKAYRTALGRVSGGDKLLVFPEGTRSGGPRPGRFTKGAFRIACEAKVEVVPVYIEVWPPILARGDNVFDFPATQPAVTITQLPSVFPDQHAFRPRALMRAVERLFQTRIAATSPAEHASE